LKVKIIGCGNILAGDDGLGVYAVRELMKMKLPKEVEVIEAGVPGLALLDLLENTDAVIILDALKTGRKKGEIRKIEIKELPKNSEHKISAHQLNLIDTLRLGLKVTPEKMPNRLVILGIEVGEIKEFHVGLSREIKEAIPKLIENVLREINFLQEFKERRLPGFWNGP
jgi:hydrogenase maturation protease